MMAEETAAAAAAFREEVHWNVYVCSSDTEQIYTEPGVATESELSAATLVVVVVVVLMVVMVVVGH